MEEGLQVCTVRTKRKLVNGVDPGRKHMSRAQRSADNNPQLAAGAAIYRGNLSSGLCDCYIGDNQMEGQKEQTGRFPAVLTLEV